MTVSSTESAKPAAVQPHHVEQAERLARGCLEILPEGSLAQRLATAEQQGRPLRVKLGMDPTSPDVHLGHAVALQKLRDFQDAGHTVVLIIGDYTALVGDPTGRAKSRPVVSEEEITRNALTYQAQAFQVLDPERTEVRRNSEWLSELTPLEMFTLLRNATVAQVLERDDFAKRTREHAPISLLELLYPLLQGYDSVAVEADIEFGGTDQLFNNLMGRHLMPLYGKTPQLVISMPLLTGTDGVEKMSKSLGNYVGLTDDPGEIFGKVMSIPDESMPMWYRLAAGLEPDDADARVAEIQAGDVHPNAAKRALARLIIERFHDAAAGAAAEQRFDTMFREHAAPDDAPVIAIGDVALNDAGRVFLPALMVAHMGEQSSGAARRMITQGAVKIDGDAIAGDRLELDPAELAGRILQVGKRRFLRIEA